MNGPEPGAYDPVELRRRIAVSFSVGDLRALAESLGVGNVAWERGIDEAAREVVKQCERYAGLPALVARLREERPLVEWPEPAAPAVVTAAPPPAAFAPAVMPVTPPVGPQAPSTSPGTFGGPLPPAGRAVPDPYAAPPGPRAGVWPGTAEPVVATPSRGVDPRILVAVAGLMLAAAIVAYLAGRASSQTASTSPSASAQAGQEGAPRGSGPAAMAADAIARSFANLARVCELPASAGGNELVFKRVFERCGPSSPTYRPGSSAPTPAPPTTAAPDPGDAPDRTAARAGKAARGDAPAPNAPASKGCMGSCDASHAVCRGHCGAEPTESSAYGDYQRCLGQCLRDASRCRLSCH